jgi:hypothetical protein
VQPEEEEGAWEAKGGGHGGAQSSMSEVEMEMEEAVDAEAEEREEREGTGLGKMVAEKLTARLAETLQDYAAAVEEAEDQVWDEEMRGEAAGSRETVVRDRCQVGETGRGTLAMEQGTTLAASGDDADAESDGHSDTSTVIVEKPAGWKEPEEMPMAVAMAGSAGGGCDLAETVARPEGEEGAAGGGAGDDAAAADDVPGLGNKMD